MLTLSVVKAGTGGHAGQYAVHPAMLATAASRVSDAVDDGLLADGTTAACGDDICLIMTHRRGADSELIHGFAWDVFQSTTRVARQHGLTGTGADLVADAFAGNLRGLGPSYAELELTERASDQVICFLGDKVEPGAWNLPLYQTFADPLNTPGLIVDDRMHAGFRFEVYDLQQQRRAWFDCPADLYELLRYIVAPTRYVVHRVAAKSLAETAAVTSAQRLSPPAGSDAVSGDPVMIVRAQAGLPTVGEILEPFAFPHSVASALRRAHYAPLMPVGQEQAHPSRFDGPPRVVALGFQLYEGRLGQPRDMFADPAFDGARREANMIMDYLRRHGPFDPHLLPLPEPEHAATIRLEDQLSHRWEPLPAAERLGSVLA